MPSSSRATSRAGSRARSRKRHRSSSTQHDLDILIQQQPHDKRPSGLRTLKLVGVGTTKDVYRKGNTVYKYHVRRSTVTRFATPAKLVQKMEKLQLVIPEVRINDAMYSTEYCESVSTESAFEVVRANILLTLMADALAQHDIYGMDLHTGNIGQRPSDGHYFIIDNEGFFEAVSTKAQPNAKMLELVNARVNYFDLPHTQACTWISLFDASQGWYAEGEKNEWVWHMLSYVAHMATVTTVADMRLRNFVSHYAPLKHHISWGLCLLPITKVYADATAPTRRAVDTFLTRYYQSTHTIPYASIDRAQPMYARYAFGGRQAWMLDRARRATFTADVDHLAKLLLKQPMYDNVRATFTKKPRPFRNRSRRWQKKHAQNSQAIRRR